MADQAIAAIEREPRWPAFVAMVAAAFLYWALPERLSVGPDWLLPLVIVVLLIPTAVSHYGGYNNVARLLMFAAVGLMTAAMIVSLVFLVQGLPRHVESPPVLLRSAAALWITNVLVFALWYWKVDAGGPISRDRARTTTAADLNSSFLFPQMMRSDCDPNWSPQFVDYLFLAFNTSTAFSPTDTAVLSRSAKLATMAQSLISLSIVALLAARAINVL